MPDAGLKHERKYTSSTEFLRKLPGCFSVADMIQRLDFSRNKADQYLSRWKSRNLVSPFSPGSGIYFNILHDESAPDEYFYQALRRIYPSAILGGDQVLHDAGWVTQIPSEPSFYVHERASYVTIDGIRLLPRTMAWYAEAMSFMDKGGDMPVMRPEMALVDLWMFPEGRWVPHPDDLYLEDAEWEKVRKVARMLGIGIPDEYSDHAPRF